MQEKNLRFIHTADWHLGQSFFGYDRELEHQAFLDWLVEQIEERDVNALLISGDIFDTSNPSARSQRMFYNFLRKVQTHSPHVHVIISSGNHDSGSRLEAPKPLLETSKISIIGTLQKDSTGDYRYDSLTIPIKDKENRILAQCIALPYVRVGDYDAANTSYSEGVSMHLNAAYRGINKNLAPWTIAMAHFYATEAITAQNDQSERIHLGGLQAVDSTQIDTHIHYLAMGHIHRPQCIRKQENLRYSGSPIPMSFGERKHPHGVLLVNLNAKDTEKLKVEMIPFCSPVRLICIKASSRNELLEQINALEEGEKTDHSPILEIQISEQEPLPDLRLEIERCLENKAVRLGPMRIINAHQSSASSTKHKSLEEIAKISPLEIAEEVYLEKYGESMSNEMKRLFEEIRIETLKQ